MEFMMTYGWALMIIIAIIGAMFALGIFNVQTFIGSQASGFPQIGATAWNLNSNGVFTIKLTNRAGSDVNITSIGATMNGQTITYTNNTPLAEGADTGAITVGTFGGVSGGDGYTIRVNIDYVDTATDFAYSDAGTVTGTAV